MIWGFLVVLARTLVRMVAFVLLPERWQTGRRWCALTLHDWKPHGPFFNGMGRGWTCQTCGKREDA